MTMYEHFMLSIVYGAVIGWLLAGIGFMIYGLVVKIRDKIKARREKKAQQIDAAETGGSDHECTDRE